MKHRSSIVILIYSLTGCLVSECNIFPRLKTADLEKQLPSKKEEWENKGTLKLPDYINVCVCVCVCLYVNF